MGQEIDSACFSERQRERFRQRLADETGLLARQFVAGGLSTLAHLSGSELEAWLVDQDLHAAPLNDLFLARFADAAGSAELGRFNVEFNTPPIALRGAAFSILHRTLDDILHKARQAAQSLGLDVVLIGTLPTLRDDQLTLRNLSKLNRYRALNEQVFAARHGEPIQLDIAGREHLRVIHRDVMLEAAATSFQIHWQLPAARAARYYNAALIASAPTLAASVNSPFLFQKDLWAETRITLFEQAVPVPSHCSGEQNRLARVGFGRDWVHASIIELFEENRDEFPVLLPVLCAEEAARFAHLRLHNGTIWRWNRPLIGFDPDGRPHLRLEHRTLPAGPTVVDMVANAALFYGLVEDLVEHAAEHPAMGFADARANFYAAARDGLDASFRWFGGREVGAKESVRYAVAAARRGLMALGIDAGDIAAYLGIIAARCASGQNGTVWQRRFIHRYPGEFAAMTREYLECQKSGRPVHEWGL